MATAIPVFEQFDVDTNINSLSSRWEDYIDRYNDYCLAFDIQNPERKKALLLHSAGVGVKKIHKTLAIEDPTGDDNVYSKTEQALNNYFMPKKNIEYEIFNFRQEKQKPSESLDSYYTRLKTLACHCEFHDVNREIKSQIIQFCCNNTLRLKALQDPTLTLEKMLTLSRSLETSKLQAAHIENNEKEEEVACIKKKKSFSKNKSNKCFQCGESYPHKDVCPAKGKTCGKCNKKNHLTQFCRTKHIKQIDKTEETSSECEDDNQYAFTAINVCKEEKRPTTDIKLCSTKINILVDTGASVNLIDSTTYNTLEKIPQLKKSNTKIFTYGGEKPMKIIGKFEAMVESKKVFNIETFYVVQGNSGNLLSYQSAKNLQIIETINSNTASNWKSQFPELFTGIGTLKSNPVKLHIRSDVKPTAQRHRRIPFHMRKKVENELERLEKLDIIEKVKGQSTPWISPIVVVPKKNDAIRICVDMRLPNKAIERERHITPTLDDVISELNGAQVFSKLDLNNGYHQLMLHQDSRFITTFTTHMGLRRYKGLSFGINAASEIFQNAIYQSLHGLKGTINISDDILVFGKSQSEHDTNLNAVLKRLKENGLTLNAKKCEFNTEKIFFFGHIFSKNGLSADPAKVTAIQNCSAPSNVEEVRSLLGMTNYVSRFIKDYSTITEPIRTLTKHNVKWCWGNEQETALQTLRNALTSNTVMSYFDTKATTEIIVDASPVGLAAILTQKDNHNAPKVIAYASRSLSDVERRYSQTEKEGLAIVWGCEHFNLYLTGHEFCLVTDHKPLELIFNNAKSKPPARIERWALRLQAYNYKIIYRPGKNNPADFLSRHPELTCKSDDVSKIAEDYVNFVVSETVPKSINLKEIQTETKNDSLLPISEKRYGSLA